MDSSSVDSIAGATPAIQPKRVAAVTDTASADASGRGDDATAVASRRHQRPRSR